MMMDDPTYSPEIEQMLDAAVAEAERGYSHEFVEANTRQIGRPLTVGVTAAAATVPVRLNAERIAALDALAARGNQTRSEVIRRAIDRELAAASTAAKDPE